MTIFWPLVLMSSATRGGLRRRLEQVWEQLTSDVSLAAWGPSIKKVTWTSPRPYGVGTTRDVVAPGGSTMRERYFRWDEGKSHAFYVYESTIPILRRFAEDYIVEPAGDQTLFTWVVAIEAEGQVQAPGQGAGAAAEGGPGAGTGRRSAVFRQAGLRVGPPFLQASTCVDDSRKRTSPENGARGGT